MVLRADDYGVAMRLVVPRTSLGEKAVALVRSNDRQALSAGVTTYDNDYQVVDGLNIKIVKRATRSQGVPVVN